MEMKKLLTLFAIIIIGVANSQTLTTSLTACYALNSNANDPINSLNGTLSAVTTTVDRFNTPNSAFYFSGASNSFIELPNSPLLKPSNAISFSAWIKPNSPFTYAQYVVVTKNNSNGIFIESYALTV